MRGAQKPKAPRNLTTWIIPADAGSTGIVQLVSTLTKDHPRGCGEHIKTTGTLTVGEGSSPRMRGARVSTRLAIG